MKNTSLGSNALQGFLKIQLKFKLESTTKFFPSNSASVKITAIEFYRLID